MSRVVSKAIAIGIPGADGTVFTREAAEELVKRQNEAIEAGANIAAWGDGRRPVGRVVRYFIADSLDQGPAVMAEVELT